MNKVMKNFLYKIEDNSYDNLNKLGFHHIGDGVYVKKIPVYKWQGYVTIYCKITAFDDSNDILVNVYQENDDIYAPYYSNDSNNEVLKVVNKNLDQEFLKCGITKYQKEK